MPQTRQLAAIMFTDIVGYTALMGKDEERAFELLRRNRELQKPIIEQHNGRWIKELGDGVMASFTTVSDAVNAAQQIQQQCGELGEFSLRIGIHHGEIVFEGDDVFGDAVNIASRIQAAAPVGGIWVSESVHLNVVNKKDISTRFIKTERLKNVTEPLRIYEVRVSNNFVGESSQGWKKIATQPGKKLSRRLMFILFAAAVAVIGVVFFLKQGKNLFASSGIESIAVLPFVNETGVADMEYLSDGMAETLINSLSTLGEVSVKARSSVFRYKGKGIDPQKIGKELAVQAVLNGWVSQRGDNIILKLELVEVEDGDLIWGEQYNRRTADLVSLQSEIALDVSNKLRVKLTGAEQQQVQKKYTQNTEAYQLYLKGRFHWNKRTEEGILKAIQLFNHAIEQDSTFALAYVGLAESYLLGLKEGLSRWDRISKVKMAAQKALKIDPSLGEAHSALASIKFFDDWNFAEAQKEFKLAIELSPNYATAHHWYAESLASLGRFNESFAEYNRALELDPLSLAISTDLGMTYYFARQYNRAIEHLKKLVELDPNYPRVHTYLGRIYTKVEMLDESLAEFEKGMILEGKNADTVAKIVGSIRSALKTSGKQGFWQKIIELEKKGLLTGGNFRQAESKDPDPFNIAWAYANLGDRNNAFLLLEKLYQERNSELIWLKVSPAWDNLRSDPRFTDLIRRVGLPE